MSHLRAKQLRKNMTDAERLLWQRLRLNQIHGHKFRRQFPIDPYIVDFICLENRLIVELDGGQHATQREYDSVRSKWLEAQGFQVIRFWNHEVMQNTDAVVEEIARKLPPTLVLPRKGGGKWKGY